MKKLFIPCALAFGVSLIIAGESIAFDKSLIYKKYSEKTGAIEQVAYATIDTLPSGHIKIKQKTEGEGFTINDEFTLDDNSMTAQWRKTRSDEDTEYVGEKKGKTLYIKGTLKGEPVDKKIALDDKPFYSNPKFNLSRFVTSDARNLKFWSLREDRLTKVKMQAKKRGEATILVNGKDMEVIKVYYSPIWVRDNYYQSVYYFRKSDGLFVKKATTRGLTTDLVSEK